LRAHPSPAPRAGRGWPGLPPARWRSPRPARHGLQYPRPGTRSPWDPRPARPAHTASCRCAPAASPGPAAGRWCSPKHRPGSSQAARSWPPPAAPSPGPWRAGRILMRGQGRPAHRRGPAAVPVAAAPPKPVPAGGVRQLVPPRLPRLVRRAL